MEKDSYRYRNGLELMTVLGFILHNKFQVVFVSYGLEFAYKLLIYKGFWRFLAFLVGVFACALL